MDLETFISWLYSLISMSQTPRYSHYCDCCTTKCERGDGGILEIWNIDQTNPRLGKKKHFRIEITEVLDEEHS